MIVTRHRWELLALILLVCLSPVARAGDTIFGTTGVSFQPVQSEGVLHGCSLVYQAVVADHAYSEGKAVVIVGSITVQIEARTVMLALKIGMSDSIEKDGPTFQAPHFVYLQTKTATTSQAKHVVNGEPVAGFRFIAVRLDEAATKLLAELLDAREVTIGFNRSISPWPMWKGRVTLS